MSPDDGLRRIPLLRGTNRPALKGWPEKASRDPAMLGVWRREFPGCNFGIVTGNGIGVLDIDTKSDLHGFGGYDSLIQVTDLLGIDLSNLPVVTTYSGEHLYFRYDGHLPSRVPWVPYLDVKADGGHQVAAPGTVRVEPEGERTYTLVRGSLDSIPYAPSGLLDAIRSWRGVSRGSWGGGSTVDLPATEWLRGHGFRMGERDNGFNTLVWKLTRTHYPHMDLVERIAFEVWQKTDNPPSDPMPWTKVQQQIIRAAERIGPEVDAQIEWARRRYGL